MVTHTGAKIKKRNGLPKFKHGLTKSIKSTGKFVSKEIDQTNKAFTGLLGGLSNPVVLIAIVAAAALVLPKAL